MKKLFHIITTSLLSLSLLTTFLPILSVKAAVLPSNNGIWTQTDWSGGSGQTSWSVTNQYNSQGGDGVYDTATPNQLTMHISAQTVVGQSNFTTGTSQNTTISGVSAYGLSTPTVSAVVGNKLIVVEAGNNRVLIYNTIPTSNGASADVVIGQPNMTSNTANNGGIGASTLNGPEGVFSDGTKLYIADFNNNRVLVYNSIPTSNGASANVVIGQPNMTSNTDNNGGIGANTLSGPAGVYSDGTKLYIADAFNNRVLVYNSIPTSNGASANVVIGQVDMVTNGNCGAVSAASLCAPLAVFSDGIKLSIADSANNRVLIYNTIPTSNGASADVVIGQPNMTSNTANNGGIGASTLSNPEEVFFNGANFFITDSLNNRVLLYNPIPTSNGASADVVIGQPNMTSNTANNGGIGANTLSSGPAGVYSDGTKLYIADTPNNRVLLYNSIPTSNGASADVVVGQPNFTSSTANNTFTLSSANAMYGPSSSLIVNNKLIVADSQNNRVLIYDTIPTSNNASANVVIGQPDFVHNSPNQGGSVAANTLYVPTAVYSDGTRLYVADFSNNRVLIYNTIPTVNDASANVVVGQSDMTSNTCNNGGLGANTLCGPEGVYSDGIKLYIADTNNNRVLIYNTIPTANDASANVVIGQPDFVHNSPNQGPSFFVASPPTASTLNRPYSVYSDGTKLYIADGSNNRVLIYNTIPTSNNASADAVLGQIDFTHCVANQSPIGVHGSCTFSTFLPPTANTLYQPFSVYSDGTKLYVSDFDNSRVLVWNTIPVSNDASADVVVGQPNFTSGTANNGGIGANTLNYLYNTYSDGAKLYVSDVGNNRLLIYTINTPHSSTLTSSTYSSGTPYTVWGPLSYTATTPANTSVSFQVSTDNGTTWQDVKNTTTQTFGPSPTLAYKVTLQNTDGLSTPTLSSVSIPYTTIPGATSSGGGSGISSSLPTPTPSISPTPSAPTPTPTSLQPTPSLQPTSLPSLTPSPSSLPSVSPTPSPTLSLPPTSLLPSSCSFTKNLYLGISDPQVRCLQIFLNTNGFPLSLQGSGSLHSETNYFGPLTQAALKKFQEAHHITPTLGYFGPITRGFILSLTK